MATTWSRIEDATNHHKSALAISENYDRLAQLSLKAAQRFAAECKDAQFEREMARHHKYSKLAIVFYGRAAGISCGCPY